MPCPRSDGGFWRRRWSTFATLTAFVVASYLLVQCLRRSDYHFHGLTGFAVLLCLLIGIISFDILRRKMSTFHTIRGVCNQYIALRAAQCLGTLIRKKLDRKTRSYIKVQNDLLLKLIRDNENTLYGADNDFKSIHSREDFVAKHPLTKYDHFKNYIDRIGKGETNVITAENPIQLAVTSGTSGSSKLLPIVKSQQKAFFLEGITVMVACMLKQYPKCRNLQKSLKIFYTPRWRSSESGLLIGPNSSSPTNSKSMLDLYSTPKAGFEIMSEPEALYIHLLFGLMDRRLGMLEANFISIIYIAFNALKIHWRDLVKDIELGRVKLDLKIDDSTRCHLNSVMVPDRKRAYELKKEFEKGFDGIAKRIWPDLNIILAVSTGSFDLYKKILQDGMCKGIPNYSPLYAASEGLIGLNIWPETAVTKYLLVPSSIFFEFIKSEDSHQDQPLALFIDQVELFENYELVITTRSGLFRYRFGDVVKVVDFYNGCPVVEFLYRQGQLLNVRGEKTSENSFYLALTNAVEKWNDVTLVDYCCSESVTLNAVSRGEENHADVAPYYVVFIELGGEDDVKLTEEQKNCIDEELQKISYVYSSFRKKGSIDNMRIYQVAKGSFQGLREFMITTTEASANQYKVPRVFRQTNPCMFLLDNRL